MTFRSIATSFFVLGFLSPGAFAHHSATVYYDVGNIVEMEGEVTGITWRNPHVVFTVKTADENGQEALWAVVGTSLSVLDRMQVSRNTVNIGDQVRAAGFPLRPGDNGMFVRNMLLPDGQEIIFNADIEPRWSNETAGSSAGLFVDESTAGAAPSDARGIFRVWILDRANRARFWKGSYPLTDAARVAHQAWDPSANPILDCTPKGMPTIMDQPFPMEFVEQGGDIRLRIEEYELVRTIHMQADGVLEGQPATPLGYSVGRWDGNTLIVTTKGINWPYFDQTGIPQSEAVEVVEHFILREDEARLDYEMTVTDPATYTEPVALQRSWVWRAGEEIKPWECVVEDVTNAGN